jgi:NAD-dependent dihydropyrimidine dehydrogenase PreA subunit
MPGMFIDVAVEASAAEDRGIAKKLEEFCPVGIFDASGEKLRVVEENLDECVLCDLCIEAAPNGAVMVKKLYQQTPLEETGGSDA